MNVFEVCKNEGCVEGKIWHIGKRDIYISGYCQVCGGTGKVVIEDKEKEAMAALILEISRMPHCINKKDLGNLIIDKARTFLSQLPNEYVK